MKDIIHETSNSNGVCIFKSTYIGGGKYSMTILANNIEIGDNYIHGMFSCSVIEFLSQHQHKADKNLTVYDVITIDKSFVSESNYTRFVC